MNRMSKGYFSDFRFVCNQTPNTVYLPSKQQLSLSNSISWNLCYSMFNCALWISPQKVTWVLTSEFAKDLKSAEIEELFFSSWENVHLLSFSSIFCLKWEWIASRFISLLSTETPTLYCTAVGSFVCGVYMGLYLGDVSDVHFRFHCCLCPFREKQNWCV